MTITCDIKESVAIITLIESLSIPSAHSSLHPALCKRTFRGHCLVFLQTKVLAHRMTIIFGLLGLKAAELHGDRTQLQV